MAKRIIIPARYASTRLPAKMLADIGGRPMLQHTYEKSLACGFDSVVIATDDERIRQVAERFGAEVCMTSVAHPTGTDRILEAVNLLGYHEDDIVVGVQGDEPLLPFENIQQVANNVSLTQSSMTTLCEPLLEASEVWDPNRVKVVRDHQGYALYFSRAPIPWDREGFSSVSKESLISVKLMTNYFGHVGLYAYRVAFLKQYGQLKRPDIEVCESLEQLRVLWSGYRIHVDIAQKPTPSGVDTLEGLERVRRLIHKGF